MSNVTTLPIADTGASGPPDAGYLLDTYLRHQREFRDEQRTKRLVETGLTNDRWYASSLGNCYRAQYLERLGRPKLREIDADARRTFAWGDHIEDFLRKMYQRCGIVEDTQIRLEHGSLVARGDLLLRFPPADVSAIPEDVRAEWSPEWIAFLEKLRAEIRQHPFVGLVGSEVKSAKSSAMKYMYKPRYGKPGPRDNHAIQVGASMVLSELVEGAPRPDFWQIEYIGKDAVGVLRFAAKDEWAETAAARWKHLDSVWDARPDPMDVKCECTERSLPIRFCGYYDPDAGTCCGNPGLTAASEQPPLPTDQDAPPLRVASESDPF